VDGGLNMGVLNPGTYEVPNGDFCEIQFDSEYDILEITVATSVPMLITGAPFSPEIGTAGVKQLNGGGASVRSEGTIVDGERTFNVTPLPLARKKRNTLKLRATNNSGGAGYVHFWVINASGSL